MNRQLPIVDIEGTSFFVDVLHEELRQQDDSRNCISFSVFDQDGNGYTFLYDTEIKNTPANRRKLKKMEPHFKWVTLPALMELDPEGIAMKYDIPLEILCPEQAGKMNLNAYLYDDEEEEDELYD